MPCAPTQACFLGRVHRSPCLCARSPILLRICRRTWGSLHCVSGSCRGRRMRLRGKHHHRSLLMRWLRGLLALIASSARSSLTLFLLPLISAVVLRWLIILLLRWWRIVWLLSRGACSRHMMLLRVLKRTLVDGRFVGVRGAGATNLHQEVHKGIIVWWLFHSYLVVFNKRMPDA